MPNKVEKLALNSKHTDCSNDVQVLILCHFYFITTVTYIGNQVFDKKMNENSHCCFLSVSGIFGICHYLDTPEISTY